MEQKCIQFTINIYMILTMKIYVGSVYEMDWTDQLSQKWIEEVSMK